MRHPHIVRTAALLCLLAACAAPRPAAPAAAPPPAEPIRLTVVATNDLHGWVQPHETRLEDGTVLTTGGVATFASYVARLREESPGGVVLVDAGDLFQGTLVANLSEGAAVIDAYNALGYDASAIGNHEFDYGPAGPHATPHGPDEDPLGALAARAAQARFPLLARNVYVASTGERPRFLAPGGLAMIERKGLKIGLLGLITPTTPTVTNPVNVAGLRFTDLADEAKAGAAELRAQGADLLIALVHAGGRCNDLAKPTSLDSCDLHGEVFEMLEALPQGTFDAVVAGHTHALIAHFVNGMPVVESNSYGTRFGTIELTIDPGTRRTITGTTRINGAVQICDRVFAGTEDCEPKRFRPGTAITQATFDGVAIAPDPRVQAVIAPYVNRVSAEQRRSLGIQVPVKLTREYHAESALGNALADAVRKMEKADIALLNSGGLRSDLPEGELTFGALFEVLPFDNMISTLTLTGAEVTAVLEALMSSGHGAPQTSGLRFEVSRCGHSAKITRIALTSGKPLNPRATYKLATSDFLALGGDGLGPVLATVPDARKDLGRTREKNMRDALADWLEANRKPLEGRVDGRMKIVSGGEGCAP